MNNKLIFLIYCILLAFSPGFSGCSNNEDDSQANLNTELRQVISARSLTGDPSSGRDLPDISEPLAQLGMKLYFTKALSGNMDTACVSCHHPVLGGGDALPVSIGVDALDPDLLGPGRMHASGHPNVPRNAPTVFNIGLWDHVMFWDGRVESLGETPGANGDDRLGIRTPETAYGEADPDAGENLPMAQARFPVTSSAEMRGEVFEAGNSSDDAREHLAARIGDYGVGQYELTQNQWLAEFQQAFNSDADARTLITYDHIAAAIGAYERSMVFVDSAWKAFVDGDDNAISRSAKQGALLFFRSYDHGGAGCSLCHQGDFFTDESFHVLATPQLGSGKGNGDDGSDDYGCFRETADDAQKYAFRTPTLLNVEVTAPYGHAGAYATLEAMVRHVLDPVNAVATYDYSQLDPSVDITHTNENTRYALQKFLANQQAGITPIRTVRLTDAQVDDLVAFLKTLTDPCVLSGKCLAPWIPDDTTADPDGLRLNAVDFNGDPL